MNKQNIPPDITYHAQIGQDQYYIENLAPEKGIFLDIGAHDGIFNSNTYALEKYLGWSGTCIEANAQLFQQLQSNRSCTCIHGAAWKESTVLTMEIPSVDTETILGSELGRVKDIGLTSFNDRFEKDTIISEVQAFKVFEKIDHSQTIDYLSLDVEGVELEVLEGLCLDKLDIRFMSIEYDHHPGGAQAFENFLAPYGYKVHRFNRWDIEFEKIKK